MPRVLHYARRDADNERAVCVYPQKDERLLPDSKLYRRTTPRRHPQRTHYQRILPESAH